MIIDVHSYALGSNELFRQKANLLAERGWGDSFQAPDEEAVARYADITVNFMDKFAVDVRLISPRPYHLMQAEKPISIVHRWIRLYNDVIATQCAMYPRRLKPVGALPQIAGEPIQSSLQELDRLANLGFVGVQINPDPGEGLIPTVGMGAPYWYPLWERLQALDMPALVVSGANRRLRQGYRSHYITEASIAALSLLENARLFDDFPGLKLIISYGGGSLPYQVGRWRARRMRRPELEPFDVSLRRLWFDTAVHTRESLELLFEVCGPDRCLFGTTQPGATTTTDPRTGRAFDDLRPIIEGIDSLSAVEKGLIFSQNAMSVFSRLNV